MCIFATDKNMNFIIKGLAYYMGKCVEILDRLEIFNREGLLVFSTTDYTIPWDGTHNGTPCPQGAYIYKFRFTYTHQPHNWHTLVGSVLLLR